MAAEKYIPLQGVNIDLAPALMPNNLATFIKNLVYTIEDTSAGSKSKDANTGIFKTMQSNKPYVDGFALPDGTNYCIGALSSPETKQAFVWIHNSNNEHVNYVLDGETQQAYIIDKGSNLNYQLDPKYFIHVGAANITILWITDPDTGEKKKRTYLHYTDGYNPQRFTCVEDAIATNGYDPEDFVYFAGDYDHDVFINAGVPAPDECIEITEAPISETSEKSNNTLLFNGWQFRQRYIDVWGRPSEYGIISDLYLPGINDCLSSSSKIPNCLDLLLKVPSPNVDKIEIAFRKNNSSQWRTADTLDLYEGSPLGKWWDRQKNKKLEYDTETGKIKYRFCNDRECRPISPELTFRLENPMPRTSVSASLVGKTEGYANNKYGFNPIPQSILDKVHFDIIPPEKTNSDTVWRNITVYVPIYNPYRDNYQQVFKDGTLGYSWGDNNQRHGGARAYKQYFTNVDQSGFYGYLVGGASAISTQVYVAENGSLIDDTDHDGIDLSQLRYNDGGYTMQKFTFTVAAGVYVFRLASHLADPDASIDIRKTSTTVWGVCPLEAGKMIPNTKSIAHTHELIINVCDSDYDTLDTNEMMVIQDLAAYRNVDIFNNDMRSIAYCGYVTESVSDSGNNIPMELVGLNEFSPTRITDHNGFYYQTAFVPTYIHGMDGDFTFLNKCSAVTARREFTTNNIVFEDLAIDSIDGNKYSDFSTTPCNRVIIKGKILLNGFDIGIPNVSLVLTRGQSTTTDFNGEFTIIAHDDMLSSPRKDKLIISNGVCKYYDRNGDCMLPIDLTIFRCVSCNGDRIIDMGTIYLTMDSQLRGLLSGGTYPVGFALKDFMDRSTFVQDLGYITIPSFQQTGVFKPSQVQVSFDEGFVVPEEFKNMVFYIGEETTLESYITWIVDRLEFVDNTGLENTTSPTQIKIYYKSLIEYNKQNNYNTTATWGFINEANGNQPYTNDNVLFLVNGDGKVFENAIISRVKYAQDGEYFLINYTNELKDLKPNAFIRLYRAKECVNDEPMFELCNSIKLIGGQPQVKSFTLNAFDTYYVPREIPVPVNTSGDDEEGTVNENRVFAYPFEHDSPSDFWGKGIKNIGRVNVKNPYEAVIYKQDEIALSGSFSENGYINYLNFFDNDLKFSFDKNNLNGIVSVLPQPGIVLFIGRNNNFVIGYDDNLVRVNSDGTLRIPSASELFGRPSPNPHFNYGCQLEDKNSIGEYEGMIHWIDTTMCGIIQHNYRDAIDISSLSCSAYIRSKIKAVKNYKNGIRYFSGACNPIDASYVISDKIIGGAYINHKREYDIDVQETINFDIFSKKFKGWFSYVGEYYSYLKGESNSQQFYSFKNGIPYMHYNSLSENGFGEFFGEEVDRIIEIVVSIDSLKKKKLLSTAVYCHSLYWVDKILTEASQDSWIPIAYWRQGDFFWSAPFLCDLNTFDDANHKGLKKLTDGNVLYGTWAKVRYVGIKEDNTKYTELTGVTVDMFPQEKSST